MQVLITGAGGFVAPHLIQHIQLTQPDAIIHGSYHAQQPDTLDDVHYYQLDLLDYHAVRMWLETVQPDVVYHLAGQSSPGRAFDAKWRTLETNIRIQHNLLEAYLALNMRPRTLIMSSGYIYCGGSLTPDHMPVNETAELRPNNPYALSKVTQDLMGLQYFLSHRLPIIRVRPFNHTGPGQQPAFVAPDFALQIARIEAGLQEPVMWVGNLEAQRDFTDVRDVVRAYILLSQYGQAGIAYNVASNQAYSIQQVLDTLLSFTQAHITVEVDPSKFRPVDIPIVQGDNTRLVQLTGWQPTIPFEQTLHDLLEDCRKRVQSITRSNE
ncbi:MAG: GDP-mannose 4,6-dehydratase [Anaerolineae bacterium]